MVKNATGRPDADRVSAERVDYARRDCGHAAGSNARHVGIGGLVACEIDGGIASLAHKLEGARFGVLPISPTACKLRSAHSDGGFANFGIGGFGGTGAKPFKATGRF